MKKIILICLILAFSINMSYAQNWDILSVKYMYTPILSTNDNNSNVVGFLQKWYIVLDKWNYWDYTKVMLTDSKIWYVLTYNLEDIKSINYNINYNKWKTSWDVKFFSQASFISKKLWTLKTNVEFYIIHTNYINSDFLKIKVINWPLKNKTWYIENKNLNLYNDNNYTSSILSFINQYKNKKTIKYLNNNNSIKSNSSGESNNNYKDISLDSKNELNQDNNSFENLFQSLGNENKSNIFNINSEVNTNNESDNQLNEKNEINQNTNKANNFSQDELDSFLDSLSWITIP